MDTAMETWALGGAGLADLLKAGVKKGLLRGVSFDGLIGGINTLSFCAQAFLHVKLALNAHEFFPGLL